MYPSSADALDNRNFLLFVKSVGRISEVPTIKRTGAPKVLWVSLWVSVGMVVLFYAISLTVYLATALPK